MAATPEPPEPQFPAPGREFADPPEHLERLAPPGKRALELMAAHLADEHGIQPFSLERHVHLGGKRTETQHLTWHPATASFHCDLCPGFVFSTGEITDEMVWSAQLFSDGLKPFLAGLRTAEERDEITRRFLSGELTDAILQTSRKITRQQAPKQPRPTVEHRKARLQDWMLKRYAQVGVFERIVEEALRLQREEPDRWAEICDLKRAESTLRRDWKQIDDARVETARREFEKRRS